MKRKQHYIYTGEYVSSISSKISYLTISAKPSEYRIHLHFRAILCPKKHKYQEILDAVYLKQAINN